MIKSRARRCGARSQKSILDTAKQKSKALVLVNGQFGMSRWSYANIPVPLCPGGALACTTLARIYSAGPQLLQLINLINSVATAPAYTVLEQAGQVLFVTIASVEGLSVASVPEYIML